MFDLFVIRVLSGVLTVVLLLSYFLFFGVFIRKGEDVGSVKASRPTGFVLTNVWFLLGAFPLIFYVLGATVPTWVYDTPLNLSFYGADFLQIFSLLFVMVGLGLLLWSARCLGQYMRVEIEVRQRHKLVTNGPYSRIRHPTYTGALLVEFGTILLFFHIVLVLGFLARVAIAHRRAILEEEVLSSEDGFGQSYRDYMLRTERFLPGPARHKPGSELGNHE